MNLFSKSILLTNLEHLNQYSDVSFWENLFLKYMNTQKNLRNLVQVCECTFCFSQPTQFSRLI